MMHLEAMTMQIRSYIEHHSEELTYDFQNIIHYTTDFPTHTHSGWEFLYVIKGTLSYVVDGNFFDIGPGNLIISRPGAIHSLYTKGSIQYERHDLIVVEHLLLPELLEQIPADLHVLNISGNKNIAGLYEKFRYYLTKLQPAHINAIFPLLINELLTDILLASQTHSQFVVSQSNAVITKVVNYIKEHVREPLTVQSLCDSLFISPSYLHYCFTKYLNVTPKQYIMVQKLQLAQQALVNAENPTKVCREFGFHNYSTFYRNYQKIYGCRPSDSSQETLQKIVL